MINQWPGPSILEDLCIGPGGGGTRQDTYVRTLLVRPPQLAHTLWKRLTGTR